MATVRRHVVETIDQETDLDDAGKLVHVPPGTHGIALGRNTTTNRALVQFNSDEGPKAIWIPWDRLRIHDAIEVTLDGLTETP